MIGLRPLALSSARVSLFGGPMFPKAITKAKPATIISRNASSKSKQVLPFLQFKRFASDEVKQKDEELGESDSTEDTGVIEKNNQETLLYFNNVLPFDLSRFQSFRFIQDYLLSPIKSTKGLENHILEIASPKDSPVHNLTINSIITKDGGAFVKFQVPYDSSIPEVNAKIQENAKNSPRPFFGFLPKPQCFPVKGTPWVEDLRRYPSSQLKIIFEGEDLTEESLYQLLRRYGPIIDIVPQALDSKEVPRYAIIKFKSLTSAISAKNCVNGVKVNETVIHIKYQRVIREHFIRDFFFNHTRIALPLLLTVMLALAAIVFEPIREFFVEEKIAKRFAFSYKDNMIIRFIVDYMSRVKRFMGSDKKGGSDLSHVWSERLDKIKELQLWLTENVNTFIVVRGPKGIGKQEMVMEHALKDRKNLLYLNCEHLVKSRNDAEFLKNVAHQFGYFPIFPWVNSLSKFIDLGVQGLTGQKSGLSESNDTQFKNILALAGVAIRKVSLKYYGAYVSQMSNDTTSGEEATKRLTEEDYLQQHPDEKPVVVIDKFTTKSENYSFVYQGLANWASFLISMNIAHVVFLVDDISPIATLTEVLPDQVFKYLVLSDASKESSRDYVLSQLNKEDKLTEIKDKEKDKEEKQTRPVSHAPRYNAREIEAALAPIGGRMLDLQAFVRRVKSGESPKEAQNEMTKQAAEQIIQMNLIKSKEIDEFETARSWELIKLLAANEAVPYSKIYTSPLFKSSPLEYLSALEKLNLISLIKQKGIVKEVRASRPLYRSAFKNIVADKGTYNVLEAAYLAKIISFHTKSITKWEDELSKLGIVPNADVVKTRVQWLGNKITASAAIIEENESKIKELASKSAGKKKKKRSILGIF